MQKKRRRNFQLQFRTFKEDKEDSILMTLVVVIVRKLQQTSIKFETHWFQNLPLLHTIFLVIKFLKKLEEIK